MPSVKISELKSSLSYVIMMYGKSPILSRGKVLRAAMGWSFDMTTISGSCISSKNSMSVEVGGVAMKPQSTCRL